MEIKVNSITFLDREDSKTRAIATLTVNDEFAVHGIKVIEGKNGEFIQMPQKKDKNGEYRDIIFPITAEARTQINTAVLDKYKNPISFDDLQLIGSYETKCDIPAADRVTFVDETSPNCYSECPDVTLWQLQSVLNDAKQFAANLKKNEAPSQEAENNSVRSSIRASMQQEAVNNSYLKASGQIVIDDALVITGVRVTEGRTKVTEDGVQKEEKKTFVNMPSYQTETGDYKQYAHPISRACYDKINSCVIAAYENIGRYTYKGVKFAELGEKQNIVSITKLNNKFAEKLMAELDKRQIPYHAKITETTTISVKSADKDKLDRARKELKDSLTPLKPKQIR